MARQRFLSDSPSLKQPKAVAVPFVLDIDLTIEDVMHDLDPNWDSRTWTGQAAAADVAELLAVLA